MTTEIDQASGTREFLAVHSLPVGSCLREAREALGYNLGLVSTQTHLRMNTLASLEADRFEELPGPVYVRGYIRAYAKLVEIDPQPLIDRYNSTLPVEPIAAPESSAKKHFIPINRSSSAMIWSSLAVAVVISGLFFSWWSVRSQDTLPQAIDQIVAAYQASDEGVEQEERLAQNSDALNQSISKPVQGQVENVEETPTVVDDGVEVAELSSPPVLSDDDQLTIKYEQASWTEIIDATQTILLHGLIKPGDVHKLNGEAPFKVFLGYAPGVVVEINGKSFDHSKYSRRNNTARFQVADINS